MESMKERWFAFCKILSPEAETIAILGTYAGLEMHYRTDPFRFYHTFFEHIEPCLNELEAVRHLCYDPTVVEMALWCHDVFYDVKRHDNEHMSAILASYFMGRLGKEPDFVVHVVNCILATAHKKLPTDHDAQFVVDIDLSYLGASWDVFQKNTENIRREYREGLSLTKQEWRNGRMKFVEGMLDTKKRPCIYCTDFFRNKYEAQARANLERSLEELRAVAN